MVLLASTTTTVLAETDESVGGTDHAAEAAAAEAAAEAAAAQKAREEAAAQKAREAEAQRAAEEAAAQKAAAEAAAAAAKEEEERAASLAAEEAAKKTDGALASLTAKISGMTDLVVDKSQSLVENVKSMTGKQKKQAVAFVAAAGFGTAFLAGAGGKAAPAAAGKGRR